MASITVPGLLRPALGLVGWTFVMEAWMYATRLPAMSKYNVNASPDTVKDDMDKKIPGHIKWKAENYNHLHEAPTRFYMVCVALAIAQATSPGKLLSSPNTAFDLETKLAWTYVGLRVVHSLVHATTNAVMVRFGCFMASETVLLGLLYKAVQLVF